MTQDDEYLISVAKTEFREAYNTGDVDRLLSVFAPGFTDWSDGEPSFYRDEAPVALRERSKALFRQYQVELGIIMAKITVVGAFAMDRGWYKVKLTDKRTGEVSNTTYRYFETWAKVNGEWKVDFVMTNKELPPRMLPEKEPAEGETAGEESPAFRRD